MMKTIIAIPVMMMMGMTMMMTRILTEHDIEIQSDDAKIVEMNEKDIHILRSGQNHMMTSFYYKPSN